MISKYLTCFDQSLFGVGMRPLRYAERISDADLPWGPYFCADIDVGSRRQEELPDPGIESLTKPLKKNGRGPQAALHGKHACWYSVRGNDLVVEVSSVAQHNTQILP